MCILSKFRSWHFGVDTSRKLTFWELVFWKMTFEIWHFRKNPWQFVTVASAANKGGGGGSNRGSLPRAPSVRGPPNSAGLVLVRSVCQSHSSLACLRDWFCCIFDWSQPAFLPALFTQIMHSYLTWLLHSPLARTPYIVLFILKPLIEDGNLQAYICTVCMHEKNLKSPQNTLQSM